MPVAAAAAPSAAVTPEPWEQPQTTAAKKSPVPLIAAAVILLAVIGGVAWYLMRPKGDAATPVQTAAATPTSTAAPSATTTAPVSTTATTTAAVTATSPAVDPSAVDQEVARRLAAERARLEAQARAQQPQTQTAAPARPVVPTPVPQPQQPPPATQTVAESRPEPVPQPVAPAPQPASPAPQDPTPARRVVREGELVAAGTEGLTPPRLTRRGTVAYPPVARMQRVEGTVITSVLVNERGQVMDVRVIRGINRPVGLNEAAEQTMRRSTFSAGSVDGVRVKAWVTVPVEFKL